MPTQLAPTPLLNKEGWGWLLGNFMPYQKPGRCTEKRPAYLSYAVDFHRMFDRDAHACKFNPRLRLA